MGEAGFFALFLAGGAVAVSLLLGPVGVAIGRRLTHQGPDSGISTGEMAAERVAQLEQRVLELEERLDFAERMLAGPAEPQGCAPSDPDRIRTPV